MNFIFLIFASTFLSVSINANGLQQEFLLNQLSQLNKPPGIINVFDITDTAINLQWNNNYSETRSHIFIYNIEDKSKKIKKYNTTSKSEEYRITELYPGCVYKFEILSLRTDSSLDLEFDRFLSKEIITDKPLDKPATLKEPLLIYDVTYTEVTLQWCKPMHNLYNTTITYNIMWSETDLWTWETIVFYSASEYPLYKITGLKSGKRYNFQVQAYNNKGSSNSLVQEEFIIRHPLDSTINNFHKETSTELKIIDVINNTVNLQWNKPENSTTNMEYAIFILNLNTMKHWHFGNIKLNSTMYKVENLPTGRTYKFIVKALDDNNSDPLVSETVMIKSPLDKPNSPKGPVYVKNITNTTVDLQWREPDNSSNNTSYTVFITNIHEMRTSVRYHFISLDKISHTVTGLQPGNEYIFYICATVNDINSDPLKSVQIRTKDL
ncbi:twitchin-like isoform X2 [Leptopilina boulardi]|uniref:twitchin-like isoform X2 n=1 Tax=Leptopilina boulardi TaxID=63433 RepID=UPI0021F61597|nr:twitchin-like isoform X2 [Leptopilina boulardi]